jgi:hypothetical protein
MLTSTSAEIKPSVSGSICNPVHALATESVPTVRQDYRILEGIEANWTFQVVHGFTYRQSY